LWSHSICFVFIQFIFRLTGYHAFSAHSYSEMIERNQKCKIEWKFDKLNINLSDEAIDLLRKMLDSDPNKRISIEEVKNHKWIKEC